MLFLNVIASAAKQSLGLQGGCFVAKASSQRHVENYHSATGEEYHLGLIGYPLAHSRSPAIHQAALQACGLAGAYSLYPVPSLPDGEGSLQELLVQVRRGVIHGLNVTIPHKQSVLPHLDRLEPTAAASGAVNTLFMQAGSLVGDNTDAAGFIGDLDEKMGFPAPGRALVLGAGGAARACVYALQKAGWEVNITARRSEQAQALAAQLPPARPWRLDSGFQPGALGAVQLLVNATSAGMAPQDNVSAWPEGLPLPAGAFIYDLVYAPAETPLLRQARRQGLPGCNGLGMLARQAALAFERWTGQPAPLAVMLAAAQE